MSHFSWLEVEGNNCRYGNCRSVIKQARCALNMLFCNYITKEGGASCFPARRPRKCSCYALPTHNLPLQTLHQLRALFLDFIVSHILVYSYQKLFKIFFLI